MPAVTIGVVADTHVPDRVDSLHPGLISGLRAAGVERIFHLGDISTNRVLDELAQVAPVTAVCGNRDLWMQPQPAWSAQVEVNGLRVVLQHGMGNLVTYWLDKFQYLVQGYRFERYHRILTREITNADVYIYGHTHSCEERWENGRFFFNPGSASFGFLSTHRKPSFGIMRISETGKVETRICLLNGYRASRGKWISLDQRDI